MLAVSFAIFKTSCSRPATCEKCGEEGHSGDTCEGSPRCVNCQGCHPSNSKTCPKWAQEKQIQQIKASSNISYKEARETFLSQESQLKNYAGAVKTAKVCIGTQTDMTWPVGSSFPKPTADTFSKPSSPVPTTKTTQTMTEPRKPKSQQQKPLSPPKPPKPPKPTKPSKNIQEPRTEPTNPRNTPKIRIQTKPSKGSDDPIKLHNRFGALEGREGEGEELMELSGQAVQAGKRGSTSSSKKPQISKG